MHLFLISGIALAIGVVGFALQNNVPVTVTLALWSFDGSLALMLLLAMGLGVLIAGLLSSPSMIKNRWIRSRLEGDKTALERRIVELEAELERLTPTPVQAEPERFPGLRSLFIGGPEKPEE